MSSKIEIAAARGGHFRVSDLAEWFGVCRNTIYNWEAAGVLPPANWPSDSRGRRIGKVKWWTREQVDALDKRFAEIARARAETRVDELGGSK